MKQYKYLEVTLTPSLYFACHLLDRISVAMFFNKNRLWSNFESDLVLPFFKYFFFFKAESRTIAYFSNTICYKSFTFFYKSIRFIDAQSLSRVAVFRNNYHSSLRVYFGFAFQVLLKPSHYLLSRISAFEIF